MLRKFALPLSLICVGAIAAFLIACGSSSSPSKSNTCTGTYTVNGDWQGSLVSGGSSDPVWGVITSSGQVAIFDDLADIASLPAITGTCSFSGTLTAYASIESEEEGTASGTVTGNVTSNTAINGSDSINGGSGTFSFTSYSPISSVTSVSGLASGYVEGQTVDLLDLTLSGTASSISLTGTDGDDCSFNITFNEETTTNVYDVAFDVSEGSCTASNMTGVGFEGTSDLLGIYDGVNPPQGTYLYAIVTGNTDAPFVVEVPPSGERASVAGRRRVSGPPFHGVLTFPQRSSR